MIVLKFLKVIVTFYLILFVGIILASNNTRFTRVLGRFKKVDRTEKLGQPL